MTVDHSKSDAQFYVSLLSVGSLALTTMVSLIGDQFHGQISQTTSLLAGGLIALCSSGASWLFRNGNGHGDTAEPGAPVLADTLEDRIRLGV